MDSPRILEFPKPTRHPENSTGGKANLIGRIAFVAVLAGLAFVDFEMGNNMIPDPALGVRATQSADAPVGTTYQMEPPSPSSVSNYYLPGQYVNLARLYDGNVITYEHD